MPRTLTIPLTLIALAWPAAARAEETVGVRDRAGLFSDDAVRQADRALREVRDDHRWQVVIETVASIDGRAIRDIALDNAKALRLHGLYVLIARDEHKLWAEPSESARKVFTRARIEAVNDAFTSAFKAKRFDDGLRDAVAAIRQVVGDSTGPVAEEGSKAGDSGVKDAAGLFSAGAVEEADRELRAFAEKPGRPGPHQVVIETVASIGDDPIQDVAHDKARAQGVRGLYVLIAKEQHKVWVQPSHAADIPRAKVEAITGAFTRAFKANRFDDGLRDAVAEIKGEASKATKSANIPAAPAKNDEDRATDIPAPPQPAPARAKKAPMFGIGPVELIVLAVVGLAAIWIVLKILRPHPAPPQNQQAYSPPPAPRPGVPPQGAPPVPPGYAPGARPGAPVGGAPGYPPPGYGPNYPPPGYGPGYAPPPPQGGGGFMSGALGGLGGAILGNVLYDQFGRPHHPGGQPHDMPLPPQGEHHPQVEHGAAAYPPAPPTEGAYPPQETYDPNAGAAGDWGGAEPPAPSGADYAGAEAGAGGDWSDAGGAEPAADWGGDPGTGGDWGGGEADAGGGGEWSGAPEPDSGGGGGEWGGGSDEDNSGGGSW